MRPLHLLPLLLPLAASTPTSKTRQPDADADADSNSSPDPTSSASPSIYTNANSGYTYYGCYNETTDLPDTSGNRALYDGTNLVGIGNMTVEMCWEFCRSGAGDSKGGKEWRFKFAGLEYARECWCAQSLSSLSTKFDDSACNLPCEGNKAQVCGGNLKLTVYVASAAAARVAWSAGLLAVGVISLSLI